MSRVLDTLLLKNWEDVLPGILKQNIQTIQNGHPYLDSDGSRILRTFINTHLPAYAARMNTANVVQGLTSIVAQQPCIAWFTRFIPDITQYNTVTELQTAVMRGRVASRPGGLFPLRSIQIVYVPRNKTHLRKLLDQINTDTRVMQTERIAQIDATHFIRVHKDLGSTPNICIFTNIMSYQLIQAVLLTLPLLMDIPTEVSEEKATQQIKLLYQIFGLLYTAYKETNAEKYTEIYDALHDLVMRLYNNLDLVNTQLRTFTQELSTLQQKALVQQATNKIQQTQQNINNTEESLIRLYTSLQEAQDQLILASAKPALDTLEFEQTIQNNKHVEIRQCSKNQLTLAVTAPLQNFDSETFARFANNEASEYNRLLYQKDALKQVLDKVFITKEYKLLVQSIIDITVRYSQPYIDFSATGVGLGEPRHYTELPNPHLGYYNCWSAARTNLQKFAAQGLLELLIPQIINAVQTVNVAEHATFTGHMLNDLCCYYDPRTRKRFNITLIDEKGETVSLEKLLKREEEIIKAKENAAQAPETNTYQQTVVEDTPLTPEELAQLLQDTQPV